MSKPDYERLFLALGRPGGVFCFWVISEILGAVSKTRNVISYCTAHARERVTRYLCRPHVINNLPNGFTDSGKRRRTGDAPSLSCCADTTTGAAIKREAHTPTTDQSEDSGVDVSATAAAVTGAMATTTITGCNDDGPGPYKRKRPSDGYDEDGRCPTPIKSNRTVPVKPATSTAGCPPFRPWNSGDESSTDVGLRLFHDIRNVDRILTLTRRHREPSRLPEPQPLDLTSGRAAVAEDVVIAAASSTDDTAVTATSGTEPVIVPVTAATTTTTAPSATAATRYSKNMSRARRIEANARERSRVHTISAAFDTLRASVPSYSKNQKLSKLSTIRIASAYILTLSRLLDMDYSAEQDGPSVDECVDNITGIIHTEGKTRKRKDE